MYMDKVYEYEIQQRDGIIKRLFRKYIELACEVVELKKMLGEGADPRSLKTGWTDVCTSHCAAVCDCYKYDATNDSWICRKSEPCYFDAVDIDSIRVAIGDAKTEMLCIYRDRMLEKVNGEENDK